MAALSRKRSPPGASEHAHRHGADVRQHDRSVEARPVHGRRPGCTFYGDRANVVRQILEAEGMPSANFYAVAGKADTDPLFPDDPFIAANRRVTITLMREDPPLPPDIKP